MAKLGIFTGTSPNDTTGDTLSQGAVKINSNFSEIYTALGDGTNITNSRLSITVAGLSTFTNGPVVIGSGIQTGDSKLQVSGDTFITGSIGIGTTNPITKLHVEGGGNFTGIVSALSFSGNSSSASYATTSGIATYATNAGTSTSVIGGIGSITQLQVTGISTFTNGPVLIGGGTSTGTAGQVLQITGISSGVYIGGSVGIGTTTPTESLHVVGNLKVAGTITGEVSSTVATATTATNVIGGIASVTQLRVGPGITTVGFITASSLRVSGITTVGFLTATNLHVSGITTVGFITASNLRVSGITTVGFLTATNAYVSGVSTFVGNSYFSNSIGIGTTNPTSSLSVNGSTVIGTEILDMTGLSSTFTTVGSNAFVVPAGVTKISAVLIGGGGAGGGSGGGSGGNGGGGGGLRYINDFPVTPEQTLTVVVGGGGVAVSGSNGGNGGDSSISISGVGIATAFGGKGGTSNYNDVVNAGVGGTGSNISGSIGGATGGSGGRATLNTGAGGGGAAGYIGMGGTGGSNFGTGSTGIGTAGSGGAGGGGGAPDVSGCGGGGVGVLGEGTSGSSSDSAGNAGSGGSAGGSGDPINGNDGGLYGGGGGGADGATGDTQIGGNGGQGVVRIIWSPSSKFSRLFPTNQVGNNINQ